MRISDWSSDVCSSDLPGLFPRDARRRIVGRSRFGCEQESFVVDAERSDTRSRRGRDDVGRVEAAAKPNLDDAIVGGDAREGEEGGGGGDLEETRLQIGRLVEHLLARKSTRLNSSH